MNTIRLMKTVSTIEGPNKATQNTSHAYWDWLGTAKNLPNTLFTFENKYKIKKWEARMAISKYYIISIKISNSKYTKLFSKDGYEKIIPKPKL